MHQGAFLQHHMHIPGGAPWQQRIPGWADLGALVLVLAALVLLVAGARQMILPWSGPEATAISLSPAALPLYAMRTTLRMLLALAVSLLFTLVYATIAAKSRRAGMILIPLLDVLQSVPILGYLSFTVVFFIKLFPGSTLGPECAAIFAIFTSQAWNMAFSFYQSLRTLPRDLVEAGSAYRFSGWQRFWRLDVPFAVPGLVWNMMMSMSGGWFFVVAAEAISVGDVSYTLPGIGAYVAMAIERQDIDAIAWAVLAMSGSIVLYDQLLFRPLVVWSERFRAEQSASAQAASSAPLLSLIHRSRLLQAVGSVLGAHVSSLMRARMILRLPGLPTGHLPKAAAEAAWSGLIVAALTASGLLLLRFIGPVVSVTELERVAAAGALTLCRVAVLIVLASLVWVPAGIAIGLRPRLAQALQPLAQFLAAFPANLLFPLFVLVIVRQHLDPRVWLSPLMILGTQWYILFNVIAGASAFPGDLREAAASCRIRGWHWWRLVMLPGVFPYFVTGAITASGGAWNASIVAEVARWGQTRLSAGGLGAYIAEMTDAGDFQRITLGIAMMSMLVILTNRLLWRPLYRFAERRTRLD
jgi:NitT/TauT family transport system permease protein